VSTSTVMRGRYAPANGLRKGNSGACMAISRDARLRMHRPVAPVACSAR
jgi:hypothetical protein